MVEQKTANQNTLNSLKKKVELKQKRQRSVFKSPLVVVALVVFLVASVIVYFIQDKQYRRTAEKVADLNVRYEALQKRNEHLLNQLAAVKAETTDDSALLPEDLVPDDAPGVEISLGVEDCNVLVDTIRREFIEEIARDQLGMVRPGEVLFEESGRR